jgi:hypothetical protein
MSFGGHDICTIDTSWVTDDIADFVEEFGERLSNSFGEVGTHIYIHKSSQVEFIIIIYSNPTLINQPVSH